jgi:hypothetical protein
LSNVPPIRTANPSHDPLSPPRSRSRRLETLLLVAFVVLVVAAFLLMLAGLIVLILAL